MCNSVVLNCLEWFSKQTKILIIKCYKLDVDRISLHSNQKGKIPSVSAFYTIQFIDSHRKWCIPSIKAFLFQVATGGIESAVYKKLIAPFKNDMPSSYSDGFRRACVDRNYAYFGPNILNTNFSISLPCQLVSLPDTSYRDHRAFITSKNSSYKGIINWRWDNKMKSIGYITDKSRLLWVPRKSLKTGGHICLLFVTRALTTGMYECFNISQICYLQLDVTVNW